MIKLAVVGRLTKDPELRFTPSGKAVVNITVAADAGFGTNKYTEFTDWQAWNKLAETLNTYLKKGSEIYLYGTPKTDKYQAADGTTRYKTRYIVDDFKFIGGKKSDVHAATNETEPFVDDAIGAVCEEEEEVPF